MKKKFTLSRISRSLHAHWFFNCALAFLLSAAPLVAVGQLQLLKDMDEMEEETVNEYSSFTSAGKYMYFVSNGELWKSNGTTKYTVRMKAFKSISNLTMSGETLFFTADDGETGPELWKSDGSPARTVRVMDIMPGADGSFPTHLTDVNGTLFFAATSPDKGTELWKSDGTSGGTVLVKDISRGSANPRNMVNYNGTLFFVATSPTGYELWRSDGTSSNTRLVKDIIEGSKSSNPAWLTVSNDKLFFAALHPNAGRELWISDGTTTGTRLLKDILPGSRTSGPENLIHANGKLMFTADDGIHGDELWSSDGTDTGTALVKDMNAGPAGSNNTDAFLGPMGHFTNINGMLYFIASKGVQEYIYRSDGTGSGTVMITRAFGVTINQAQPEFTYRNGYVYFFNSEFDNDYVYGLYRMPYKGEMITRVQELQAGTEDFYAQVKNEMIFLNGYVLFPGRLSYEYQAYGGFQLIRSDGTPEGTVPIHDTFMGTMSSRLEEMIAVGGKVYFLQYSYLIYYASLYSTDGTPEGTIKVRSDDGWFYESEPVGNDLYYVEETYHYSEETQEYSNRWQLSKTSGTMETTSVMAFGEGLEQPSRPQGLTDVNGTLYYFNALGEVWKSNGTVEGTMMVADIHSIVSITNVEGQPFVLGSTSDNRIILWKITPGGLAHITTLFSASLAGDGMGGIHAASVGNTFYFLVDDHNGQGFQIWLSNGTASGTYKMFGDEGFKEGFGYVGAGMKLLIPYDGELYFSNREALFRASNNAYEKVADLTTISNHVEFKDKLFLFTSGNELELYVTDGTSAGTTQLHHREVLHEGYIDYAKAGDYLYFNTLDSPELWRTDGTACGTTSVDVGASKVYPLEAVGDDLVFGGYKVETGLEPYAYHNVNSIPGPLCEDEMLAASHSSQGTQEEMLTAYPNPFVDSFSLKITGQTTRSLRVDVYTVGGMPVERLENVPAETASIQLGSHWQKGHYIIKVRTVEGVETYHVMKE